MPHVGTARCQILQLKCTTWAISVHDYQKTHYLASSHLLHWTVKSGCDFFFLPLSTFLIFCGCFFLVFPPQLGVLSQVESRDVFPGSRVQIGIAQCHLCAKAYLVQQLQHVNWPTGRADASSFNNDVFAFRSLCLQSSYLRCVIFSPDFFFSFFAFSLHSSDF